MTRLKYVMVTHWKDHWDKLHEKNNETHFKWGMLKFCFSKNKIRDGTPTIFIKLNEKTREPEKAWVGSVHNIRIGYGRKIFFKVKIDKEIPIPEEFKDCKEGWYIIEEKRIDIPEELIYYPPFFYILRATKDYKEFELYVYTLLKLLGIHNIFRYEKQRGHPDGFFVFGNLAVIYDATLEENFENSKKVQIDNYCNILKNGNLEYRDRKFNITSYNKQVWIITRGRSRIIKRINSMIVKEITIEELVKIYLKKLKETIDEKDFEKLLSSVCE